jgi:hypothetical protein
MGWRWQAQPGRGGRWWRWKARKRQAAVEAVGRRPAVVEAVGRRQVRLGGGQRVDG